MPLTPEQRIMRARIAAHTRWGREDPTATAERGQAGLRARFHREVAEEFPDISEAETARRAASRLRAHMTRLSLMASKAHEAG